MQADISRQIRSRSTSHILDVTGADEKEAAIYALADPRDVELVRYIGQTRAPRSRRIYDAYQVLKRTPQP